MNPRIFLLIAAIICLSRTAQAGVISAPWLDRETVMATPIDLDEGADRVVILQVAPGNDISGVSNVNTGTGTSVAVLLAGLPFAVLTVTGRICVGDPLLPQQPVLDSLPRPS